MPVATRRNGVRRAPVPAVAAAAAAAAVAAAGAAAVNVNGGVESPAPLVVLPAQPTVPGLVEPILTLAEQEAENLAYDQIPLDSLARDPLDDTPRMWEKIRQQRRRAAMAGAAQIGKTRVSALLDNLAKLNGAPDHGVMHKNMFSSKDGEYLYIHDGTNGQKILDKSNQIRRMMQTTRKAILMQRKSTLVSEKFIWGEIENMLLNMKFDAPFQNLDQLEFSSKLRILQRSHFKYLITMDCDLLSPNGFNLSSFLKVGTQMNDIEDLIIAFTNLQLVFSSFYDPVWADCCSGPIAKLRTKSATQCGFDFIRHKFEVFFKGFRHEIVNREAGDVHQKLDTPRKCRELFISVMVVTDEMLTERKERDFLNSHKRAYLMRIEDAEQEGIVTKKSKVDKALDKGIPQTSVGHSKPTVDPKKICIFWMYDKFNVLNDKGQPCSKCTTKPCPFVHPAGRLQGTIIKEQLKNSVKGSFLEGARFQ